LGRWRKLTTSNEKTAGSIHVEVSELEPKRFEVKANASEEAYLS
jgi:hypothetical protein